MKEPLTWDFENARTCVLLHKKPYKTGESKQTFMYDENGTCIFDYCRRYNEIKKAEGRIAADSARRKWKSKEKKSSWEKYYVEKYWEISGIVFYRKDDWMCSLDVTPDRIPDVIGEYTLEDIISERNDIMEVQQKPRHCLADWVGLGTSESLLPLVIRRLGFWQTKINYPYIYSQDEIRLIANETVNAARQYLFWYISEYDGNVDNPYLKSSLGILPYEDVYENVSDGLVDIFYRTEDTLREWNMCRKKSQEFFNALNDGDPDCWKKGFLF